MSYSGTYAFAPSLADVIQNAFSRIQLRGPALLAEHMRTAAQECNLLQVEFGNKGPNLWTIETTSVSLVEGTRTYSLSSYTLGIVIAYIRTGDDGSPTDRVIMPISDYEYQAFPNKLSQGTPTVYWFNRQIDPEITLWQVPDGNGPYTLVIEYLRQIQDATVAGGLNPQIPYRFADAYVAGLAARLAVHFKPELAMQMKAMAKEAWDVAATNDTQNVGLYLTPGLTAFRAY